MAYRRLEWMGKVRGGRRIWILMTFTLYETAYPLLPPYVP